VSQQNLFEPLPPPSSDEVFQELLRGGRFRLERIVSTGQATPQGQWYDQETAEWVLLLSGSALLRFEDEAEPRELRPGDWVNIGAHRRHRVDETDPEQPTIWLALHYEPTIL
jgi:cupin 2 domain-containing protein